MAACNFVITPACETRTAISSPTYLKGDCKPKSGWVILANATVQRLNASSRAKTAFYFRVVRSEKRTIQGVVQGHLRTQLVVPCAAQRTLCSEIFGHKLQKVGKKCYDTLLYNTIQCSAMQCNAMQCNALQCSAVQCSAAQCNAVPYHTIPYHTIPYPYHTIPYRTVPYHTIPHHTIPYHTIPYP